MNVDWNGSTFDSQTAAYDKSKPVFVYRLSGARSASAAKHWRQQGFSQVIEMVGGMMKWRAGELARNDVDRSKEARNDKDGIPSARRQRCEALCTGGFLCRLVCALQENETLSRRILV